MHLFFDLTQANFLEVLAGRAVQLTDGLDYLPCALRHVLEWNFAFDGTLNATIDSGRMLTLGRLFRSLQIVDCRLRLKAIRH